MNHEHVDEALVHQYLAGAMTEDEREAFERRYFECARCLDEVKRHWAVEAELRRAAPSLSVTEGTRRRRRPFLVFLPAAAAALAVIAIWQVTERRAVPDRSAPDREASARTVPAPVPSASTTALQQLARIEPPAYVTLRTRSPSDASDANFERGMDAYSRGDYQNAAAMLRTIHVADGGRVDFFLGVSLAMIGDADGAIEALTRAARPSSPYSDDARVMLAKVYLRKGDGEAAARELTAVAQEGGRRAADARALLDQIRALK